jgi:hypothetical protein
MPWPKLVFKQKQASAVYDMMLERGQVQVILK